MSLIDLLWLFIILSSLQPVFRQRLLESRRLWLFRKFEQQRKSRAIGLIHRQETMSFLGFPIARYIDIEDSERLLRAIQLTDPTVPIDLILHTPGGLVLAADQIAHALRRHRSKVTVFVPHYAMSGGTLIALAADQIVLAENAVLGPVDPQLGQSPAASIRKVVERKPIARIDDSTLIQADMAEKALRQVERSVRMLIGDRMPEDKAASLAETLSCGTWTHDYPISVTEAQQLGLPVTTNMPAVVYDLMQLYPQTGQRRPSVEYIPQPYGPPDRRGGGHPASRGSDR
jgi:ClpP class serine protease